MTVARRLMFAAGIALGHLAVALALIVAAVATDAWRPPGPIGGPYLVEALSPLLWPALLGGRIGLSHTWIVQAMVLGLLFLVSRRLMRGWAAARGRGFTAGAVAALPFLALALLGWLYVHVLPVPLPAFPSAAELTKASGTGPEELVWQWRSRLPAYEEGYRKGMVNGAMTFCAFSGPTWPETQYVGFAAGASEWGRVLPGFTITWVERDLMRWLSSLPAPPRAGDASTPGTGSTTP